MNWLILVVAVVFFVIVLLLVMSLIENIMTRKHGRRITVRNSIDEHGIVRFKHAFDLAGKMVERVSLAVKFSNFKIEYCNKNIDYAYKRDFSMYNTDLILFYDHSSEIIAVMTSDTLRLYGGVNKVFTINDDITCQSR